MKISALDLYQGSWYLKLFGERHHLPFYRFDSARLRFGSFDPSASLNFTGLPGSLRPETLFSPDASLSGNSVGFISPFNPPFPFCFSNKIWIIDFQSN